MDGGVLLLIASFGLACFFVGRWDATQRKPAYVPRVISAQDLAMERRQLHASQTIQQAAEVTYPDDKAESLTDKLGCGC